MKRFFILCVMIFLYHSIYGQNKIKGTVFDNEGNPLAGATVHIYEMNKGTFSDDKGNYYLNNIPEGYINIRFEYIGYSSVNKHIEIKDSIVDIDATLEHAVIETEEIVITGGFNSTQHENAVKIDVLKLKSNTGFISPNFSETLTKVPGVDMISKGIGVSKPVIRGLSMNDILVLNNGVRFENYQYSSHHPLGIDESGIEAIEIIKGPASLLYGSDAIGGVINFIREKPAKQNSAEGVYNMQLFSNSLGLSNNIGIKGASEKLFAGVNFGIKSHSDYLQGEGSFVPNSRFNEYSIKANTGFTDQVGSFKLFYDYNQQNLGLSEEEAVEKIDSRGRSCSIFYQKLNTHLLSLQNKLFVGKIRIDANAAYQNTELIHFGDNGEYELQMNLATISYEVKALLPSSAKNEYIIGFQGYNQKNINTNNRETILLPNATIINNSLFGLLRLEFIKNLKLQAGARYDLKSIDADDNINISNTEPFSKDYGSFSGSAGATYNLSDILFLRANIASAYRTPNLPELTSNGQHETRFELGNHDLKPESSLESDFSMHFHNETMTFDVACFYNNINNYIYISPTGITTESGLPVYKYLQSDSKLYGYEAGAHLHPRSLEWLHLQVTYSSVLGIKNNGEYLPFVPANKLNTEVKAEKEKLWFMRNAFISMLSHTALDQDNQAPDEFATDGYTIFDANIGCNIIAGKQNINLKFTISNILDKKYIDHLSTLKEVNFFNPGRNIALTINLPFIIKNK